MATDPFDSLFSLEDKYYAEGYEEGRSDGLQQSELEARLFGIEKGFEKFVIMGKLQARAKIWAARLPHQATLKATSSNKDVVTLSRLSTNPRLEKHITTLQELVDLTTLSIANTDDDVGDFDERLRRAQAKVKIIERMIGEEDVKSNGEARDQNATAVNSSATKNMEDFGLR